MPVSVERFVQALTSTGIMTPAEAEALVQSLPPEKRGGDADELARNLVRQGKLTRFQAAAIYQDKADGLLLGNYLILDKLGAGGMGQVFRARHRRMDRVVAIKVLSKKLLDSPDAVARFQREAKAAARLTHPNIVTAYDADEAGGMHFLVMEYVDGTDLAGLVKQQGPLPPSQALDYLLQAARGLEHAHGEGVVHRDIKPSNLLLDKKGTLKILDMGLARMSDPLADPSAAPGADLTHSGSIMGTIDYMAPEQAMDSRQADARSDIYSLGCTLHYLLTARPPYGGDTILKRLTAHQQAAIPLLSTTRPDIPPGYDEVFGRMMAKRPAARYQTSKDLVAALEALRNQPASSRPVPIAAQPITAQPVAVVPATLVPSGMQDLESIMLPGIAPGSRRARKSKSKVPLIAAVVVLLLAGGGVGAWLMLGHKPDEIAQSEPTPPTEVQHPAADLQPAAGAESKPAAEPPKEPTPVEAPSVSPPPAAPPEAMPAKIESPANAAPRAQPPVVAPVATDVPSIKTAPPVAMPAVSVASSPPSEQPAGDAKLQIPSGEGRREAQKLIKELYKDDYAQAKQPDAKAALAEKLLNESQQTKDDATALYSVLREARDLAVEAANPALAERAIGMLAGRFAVEPLKELAAALDEMSGKPHPADANRAITETALARVEEAQATNDFETAKQLADVALAAARKSKDGALSKRAVEVGKTVTAAKQQWDGWQKAQATLAQTPNDPAANLAVGRYLCVVQGDWDQGLAHLAKGPDGPLQELAAKSLKPPDGAAALAELGDAWFVAAEKAKGKDKADLRAGAAYWYTQAEPGLTGLVRTIVEKRLKDLGGSVAVRVVRADIPVANGLWLPQTFDCSAQAYSLTLGPDFNLQKSWTLALEFRTPNLAGGSHQLFFWGDGRNSRDPLCLRIDGDQFETRLCDAFKDQDDVYFLKQNLSPDVIGAWQQAAVHYDAPTNDVSLSLNGAVLASGRSTIVPAADRPMKLWLGGAHETGQRFTGQLRNVWLGNTDKSSPPDTKSLAAAAAIAGRKLPETIELSLAPGVGMKFRLIPAGTFLMGRLRDVNKAAHTVRISQPFYLGVTEVTQSQWFVVMGNNPGPNGGDTSFPVGDLSWNDCQDFVQRLNQSPLAKSVRFRMPTEAEWEYACRAGTSTEYCCGDDPKQLTDYAWFKDNSGGAPHAVGQRRPNAWGIYDMHGNHSEWCNDWYDADYYTHSPETDPSGPDKGETRVLRGGGWGAAADSCSSSQRQAYPPETRYPNRTLRLACQPKSIATAKTGPGSAPGSAKAAAGRPASVGSRPMAFNQADIERNVANWVLSLGGKVKVTSPAAPEQNPLEVTAATQLPAEPFLLYGIDLGEKKPVTDEDLARIENLANLIEFTITSTPLGDEGLAHVARQRNLIRLTMQAVNLTDSGIAAVEGLTRLRALYVGGNKLTDAGVAHVRGLTDLRYLSLGYMPLTGEGIKHLYGLPHLLSLSLQGAEISDADLQNLRSLKMVSILDLTRAPRVTDQGLKTLVAMPSLSNLVIPHTAVSDKGLEILAKFPGLKRLELTGSAVTDAGVQRFRQLRPDCDVIR